MKNTNNDVRLSIAAAAAALLLLAGCVSKVEPAAPKAMPAAVTAAAAVPLSGAQQVPPNPSAATGTSTIRVGPDMVVTGMLQVTGMAPTMAHIHAGAPGIDGPLVLHFARTGENTFAPAPGAKLTPAQYASYQQGKLFVNVHSAAYPGGEIRAQLVPAQ